MSTVEIERSVCLKCQAGRGMFEHEAAVLIRGVDQSYESMIDSEFVRLADDGKEITDDYQPAFIEVQIIKESADAYLVELPRQVVSGGRRIWVPKSEVSQ